MLLLDTALCILDVNSAIREITGTIMSNSTESLTDRYNGLVPPGNIEAVLYAFMVREGHSCR